MNEFILLYRRTPEIRQETMGSPEKAQQTMKKWRTWMDELTQKGHLKAIGQPLDETGKVVGGKKKTVTDGPYKETKDLISGYSVIQARDLEEAAQIALGCPIVEAGGLVEVRPVMQLNL